MKGGAALVLTAALATGTALLLSRDDGGGARRSETTSRPQPRPAPARTEPSYRRSRWHGASGRGGSARAATHRSIRATRASVASRATPRWATTRSGTECSRWTRPSRSLAPSSLRSLQWPIGRGRADSFAPRASAARATSSRDRRSSTNRRSPSTACRHRPPSTDARGSSVQPKRDQCGATMRG